jgi:hypothetical protein
MTAFRRKRSLFRQQRVRPLSVSHGYALVIQTKAVGTGCLSIQAVGKLLHIWMKRCSNQAELAAKMKKGSGFPLPLLFGGPPVSRTRHQRIMSRKVLENPETDLSGIRRKKIYNSLILNDI